LIYLIMSIIKTLLVLGLVALATFLVVHRSNSKSQNSLSLESSNPALKIRSSPFQQWKKAYGKTYRTKEEEKYREKVFYQNY